MDKTPTIFIASLCLEDCVSLLVALDVSVSIGENLKQIIVSFCVIYEETKRII